MMMMRKEEDEDGEGENFDDEGEDADVKNVALAFIISFSHEELMLQSRSAQKPNPD